MKSYKSIYVIHSNTFELISSYCRDRLGGHASGRDRALLAAEKLFLILSLLSRPDLNAENRVMDLRLRQYCSRQPPAVGGWLRLVADCKCCARSARIHMVLQE
jgi:hypothetical protein